MKVPYSFLKIKSVLRHPVLFLQQLFQVRHGTARWSEESSLSPDWDSRTILIAGLVPEGARVLEFGAANLVLKEHLPDGCFYQPSDIVSRSEDTIVCDLNRCLPDLGETYTHVVFSGVIEYIHDVSGLLEHIAGKTGNVIVSYTAIDSVADYVTRKRNGWVNHYSDEQFVHLFREAGFVLKGRHAWRYQEIYVFERTGGKCS
ncbi:methyltransferase domain-containing protein [Thiolapillus sp.]